MRILLIASLCQWLAGCDSTGGSTTTSATRKLTPAEMLAQVRASGKLGNELDVQPWRDPQVEDLRLAATAAESRGDVAAADQALQGALGIATDDPDLLQWRAELALLRRDWAQAEQLALRSYEKGPKLGGLCRRNWSTAQYAREARGDVAGMGQAQQRVASCAVTPPPRY